MFLSVYALVTSVFTKHCYLPLTTELRKICDHHSYICSIKRGVSVVSAVCCPSYFVGFKITLLDSLVNRDHIFFIFFLFFFYFLFFFLGGGAAPYHFQIEI